jgi:hypothetical protein
MNRLALVLLLLAATPTPSSAPGTSTSAVAVHDPARLTAVTAWALHGKRALFLIALDSTEGEHDGLILFDCAGPEDDVLRSVRLLPDQEIVEDMIVEATLRVVIHEPRGQFLGFVELRLDRARRTW